MRLCKSQFPWKSCIMDGTSWCCPGSSVISGNQYQACSRFGYTGCNCTDTGFWYQFYCNSRIFVRIFTIVNELRKILDRIDIMMRRWWDQADPRCRMTCLCNPRIYFSTRQMSALSRFCPLRHLDLYFLCTYQVSGCNAKSSGSYLFDRRASVRIQTFNLLSTFTTVGFTMQLVHRNCQCLMRFFRDRTIRHCSCLESFYNLVDAFYFFDWNAFLWIVEF